MWLPTRFKRNHTNKFLSNSSTSKIGPPFSEKTYLALKKLSNRTDRSSFVITRFPDKYEDFGTTIEVLDIVDYEGAIVVFDDNLKTNKRTIDLFFTRGRQKDLDV